MIYLFHVKAAKHQTIKQEIDNYILNSKYKQTSNHTKVFIVACQYAFQNVFFIVCFSFIFVNQCLFACSVFISSKLATQISLLHICFSLGM